MKAYLKPISLIFSVLLLCPLSTSAGDLSSLDTTIQILQEQIARQIERIQAARQKADDKMSLTRARVEQQLEVAQQDLALQVEKLQQLRAQLQDKTRETEEKIAYWQSQGTALISKTLSEISNQINATNQLIQRLNQLTKEVNCNCPNKNNLDQGLPTAPQTSNSSIPDLQSADTNKEPLQKVAMVSFPDPEPITFALPPVPTG